MTKNMSSIKKVKTAPLDLSIDSSGLSKLPAKDRAVIYAMTWCNSEKSNLPKYELERLLNVANSIFDFIK